MRARHALLLALLVAVVGVVVGLVRTGSEPSGLWVDCGPALFHAWGRLPDPACAGARQPLQTLAVLDLATAGALLLYAVRRLVRGSLTRSSATP